MWHAWEKREMGGQREGRRLLGRYRYKFESNIKFDLKGIG
jgi:hypothetical protein